MRDSLVKLALVGIPADEHGAIAAALHRSIIGRQVEVSLHLVGVMALEALVAEDGQDLVLVGDLVCRNEWNCYYQT